MNDIKNVIPNAAEGSRDIYPLPHQTPRRCSGLRAHGFTLVELTIVLMVIGLVIGGVLKGHELIENARITNMARYISEVDAAIAAFSGIYNGELPGDMINAGELLPNCTGDCAKQTPYTGDGKITAEGYTGGGTFITEANNFWRHLNLAGLIGKTHNHMSDERDLAEFMCGGPDNILGGRDFINYMPPEAGVVFEKIGNYMALADDSIASLVPGAFPCNVMIFQFKHAKQLDRKLDDSKPLAGEFRVAYIDHPSGMCHNPANEDEYAIIEPEMGCYAYYFLSHTY